MSGSISFPTPEDPRVVVGVVMVVVTESRFANALVFTPGYVDRFANSFDPLLSIALVLLSTKPCYGLDVGR